MACLILTVSPFAKAANDRFLLDGKVLSLTDRTEGQTIEVQWQAEDGTWAREPRFSRVGQHLYEMRQCPQWRGYATQLMVNGAPVTPEELIQPSLKDEVKLFLTPEPWTPSTICYLYGHTVGGIRWEWVLFAVVLILAGMLMLLKRGATVAFFSALLIAFIIADLRSDYDHAAIIKTAKDNAFLGGARDIKTACELASGQMGRHTWTSRGLWVMLDNVVGYRLAEQPYVATESNADFVVSFEDQALNFVPQKPK